MRWVGRVACSDDGMGFTRLSLASVSANSAICKSIRITTYHQHPFGNISGKQMILVIVGALCKSVQSLGKA
jgi:hypothetical protein